jgi:Flp pilus assembly protein TadD
MSASTLPRQDNKLPDKASVAGSVIESNEMDEKEKGELQSSESYYAKVVAAAHNNIGLLRAELQDFRAAAQHFALAAKWNPQQGGLDYNLGLAYYKSESYKEAAPPLETELKAHPGNRPAAMLLGMTWFRLGNYVRASEFLNGVLNPPPTDINIYYALASSLIKQGKADAADRVILQMKTVASDGPFAASREILLQRCCREGLRRAQ